MDVVGRAAKLWKAPPSPDVLDRKFAIGRLLNTANADKATMAAVAGVTGVTAKQVRAWMLTAAVLGKDEPVTTWKVYDRLREAQRLDLLRPGMTYAEAERAIGRKSTSAPVKETARAIRMMRRVEPYLRNRRIRAAVREEIGRWAQVVIDDIAAQEARAAARAEQEARAAERAGHPWAAFRRLHAELLGWEVRLADICRIALMDAENQRLSPGIATTIPPHRIENMAKLIERIGHLALDAVDALEALGYGPRASMAPDPDVIDIEPSGGVSRPALSPSHGLLADPDGPTEEPVTE
jgi:hypothetical protein